MTTRRHILFSGGALLAAGVGQIQEARGQATLTRKLPRRPIITGAETAVTAFVGRTFAGPLAIPTRLSSFAEFTDRFGPASDSFPMGRAVSDFFANGGRTAVILRLFLADEGEGDPTAQLAIGSVSLKAASPGDWGNSLVATIDTVAGHGKAATFSLSLRTPTSTEKFVKLTLSDGPRRIDKVLAAASYLARWDGDLPNPARGLLPGTAQAEGGADGALLTPSQYVGDGTPGGLSELDATTFNLLCIPPDLPEGDTAAEVYQAAHAYCVTRLALLIVDPPVAWKTAQDATTGLADTGLVGADNAALYFPRLTVTDATGAVSTRAACGAIAGVYARSDVVRGVWAAPAGSFASLTTGAGIPGLATLLSDGEGTALVAANINPLRRFTGAAPVVFGARTLSSDPDRHYVNVVRTAQYIESSIRQGMAWVTIAANDATTWTQVQLAASAFLHGLFLKGAFIGATASNAYFVRCDATTTTPADIAAGRTVLLLGFAQLRPAEFLILRVIFQHVAPRIRPL